MPEFCDPAGVDGRFGIASGCVALLNPRLPSGKPPACGKTLAATEGIEPMTRSVGKFLLKSSLVDALLLMTYHPR
jgi:hypothetical protein